MTSILQCDHVGVRIEGHRELLRDLHLNVAAGELTIVVGARGAGKSLLAAVAAGMRAPDRGQVTLFGEVQAERMTAATLPSVRRRIGFVGNEPILLKGITLADQVALPLRVAGARAAVAREMAAALLRRLGEDRPTDRASPHLLPARRRRTALARALVARPQLIVLDTPLREADRALTITLAALLLERRAAGAAILLTADDAGEAAMLGTTNVIELSAGQLHPLGGAAAAAAA